MSTATKNNNNMNKWFYGSLLVGSCVILLIATLAQAQYNTYDSDSNSDSDGNPILSNSELGKLVRGSANGRGGRNSLSAGAQHHHQPQHNLAATRNLYNRQQPLQHAQTHNYRQSSYGRGDSSDADGDDSSLGTGGYNPSALMGAASHGRSGSNADNDDDDGANFGPNFDSNVDSDEGQANGGADGSPMNLNQAASGYPGQGNEGYGVGDGSGAGYGGSGFGGSSGYGPSSFEGSEFGPEAGFSGGDGRRAKSASSLMGMSNYGTGRDDDAGAPQYGPNSAINAGGDGDDDARSNYAPEASQNDDNDDE